MSDTQKQSNQNTFFSVETILELIKRFPIPLLVSVAITILFLLDASRSRFLIFLGYGGLEQTAAIAFLCSGAAHLFFERFRPGNRMLNYTAAALAAVLATGLTVYQFNLNLHIGFLTAGCILLLMVMPFLAKAENDEAIWLYNARFLLAALLAIVASVISWGGMAAILSSMEYLFGLKVGRVHYDSVMELAILLIGPIFGLSLMPKANSEAFTLPKEKTLMARAMSILINFILVPILLIYIIIIHLYAGKIIVDWTLPKGQVATMVLFFSFALIAFVLISKPWKSRATRFTRMLLDYWPYLLLTPLFLLTIATFKRISDYGVTPERYGLVLIGLWIGALFLLALFYRKDIKIPVIITPLACLLILSAIGPWGAIGYSISNQVQRFENLLKRNQLLENGILKADVLRPDLENADKNMGYSIVQFLDRYSSLSKLNPYFEKYSELQSQEYNRNYKKVRSIHSFFGFGRKVRNDIEHFSYRTTVPATFDVKDGKRLIGPFGARNRQSGNQKNRPAWIDQDVLRVKITNNEFSIELQQLEASSKKYKANTKNHTLPPFTHTVQANGETAELIIYQFSSSKKDDEFLNTNISFWLLIGEK